MKEKRIISVSGEYVPFYFAMGTQLLFNHCRSFYAFCDDMQRRCFFCHAAAPPNIQSSSSWGAEPLAVYIAA